jgi:hypothetical protein
MEEIVGEYNTIEKWKRSLLSAKKALAIRYLKNPHSDLKLPDVQTSHHSFWVLVNEAVDLAFSN